MICPADAAAPTPPVVNDNCGRPLTVSAPVVSAIPACSVRSLIHLLILIAPVAALTTWVTYYNCASSTAVMPAGTSGELQLLIALLCCGSKRHRLLMIIVDHQLTVRVPVVSADTCLLTDHLYIYLY